MPGEIITCAKNRCWGLAEFIKYLGFASLFKCRECGLEFKA